MENSYERQFDKHIRAKLENFTPSGTPEGWESLSHKMAADPDLSPADPFDEMVKSKLEANPASYNPTSWSLLESRIEADAELSVPELDNVQFDGLLYEHLHRFEVPYNPSHWTLMARRIQAEISLQSKLYQYKITEAVLMLLVLLTFIQYFPGNPNANQPNLPQAIAAPTNTPDQLVVNNTSEEPNTHTNENLTDQPVLAQATTSVETEPQPSNNTSTNRVSSQTTETTKPSSGQPAYTYSLPELEIHSSTGNASNQHPAMATAARIAQSKTSGTNEGNTTPAIPSDTPPANVVSDQQPVGTITELLALESATLESLPYTQDANLPKCVFCKQRTPIFYQLGMMASMDLNNILTPYNEKFDEESYNQLTTGYTGGISFGIYQGRFGVNTGFVYSSKKYLPKANYEYKGSLLEGYTGEGLTAAQLNILSIPLNLTYTFDGSGKWQWYVLGGASAKLAAVNNFDFKTFSVGSARTTSLVDPRQTPQQDNEAGPYDGILEGGRLSDNLFLTTNFGVGMERYFSHRWSVFLQPVYQHYIYKRGLGPNNDRIHSMSLFLGARARLK